jgi:hypothetical protein
VFSVPQTPAVFGLAVRVNITGSPEIAVLVAVVTVAVTTWVVFPSAFIVAFGGLVETLFPTWAGFVV